MKFASIFAALNRYEIENQMQESQLASYSNFDFVCSLKPILKQLSALTARTYRSYLFEAQEMILQGESEENIYTHFFMRLCRLQNGTGEKNNDE